MVLDGTDVRTIPAVALHRINTFLSAATYSARWKNMPKREIFATSVIHPHGREADQTPWNWILDTKCLQIKTDTEGGYDASTRSYVANADGTYPAVRMCWCCFRSLALQRPKMPVYALANDNLMLREPFAFRDSSGKRLSPATFMMLSLARMVVKKIIAEKDKKTDPK